MCSVWSWSYEILTFSVIPCFVIYETSFFNSKLLCCVASVSIKIFEVYKLLSPWHSDMSKTSHWTKNVSNCFFSVISDSKDKTSHFPWYYLCSVLSLFLKFLIFILCYMHMCMNVPRSSWVQFGCCTRLTHWSMTNNQTADGGDPCVSVPTKRDTETDMLSAWLTILPC